MFQTMTTENLFGTTWKSGTNVVHYVITDTLPWTIHESAGPAIRKAAPTESIPESSPRDFCHAG